LGVSAALLNIDSIELGAFTLRLSFGEAWIRELAEDMKRACTLKGRAT